MDSGTKLGGLRLTSKSKKADKKSQKVKRLVYKNWEPGGEYTLPLHLKNVKLRTQKVYFE